MAHSARLLQNALPCTIMVELIKSIHTYLTFEQNPNRMYISLLPFKAFQFFCGRHLQPQSSNVVI